MTVVERRLLLVEDDAAFAESLMRSFERRAVHCQWLPDAYSVRSAIVTLGQQGISDVVLDMNLGDTSGLALIPELRRALPTANILVLTGYASIATTVMAIKAGADNYLAKPADASAILKALDQDADEDGDESGESSLMSVPRMEWEYIQRVLVENEGNISATARALNMHRRTLQRKLAKRPVGR